MSHEVVRQPDHLEHHFQYFGQFFHVLGLDQLLDSQSVGRQEVLLKKLVHDFENLILLMNWLRGFIVAADTAEGGTSIDHDLNELLLCYLSFLEVLCQQD